MKPTVKLVYVTTDGREWSSPNEAEEAQRNLAIKKLVRGAMPREIDFDCTYHVERLVQRLAPKIAEIMANDFSPENHDGPKISPIEDRRTESDLVKSLAKSLK